MTWASERCAEIPIARDFLARNSPKNTLEVGNVLSHYGPVGHHIVDKFEKARGVINEDITTYRPNALYDLILSISTFEHIGFDDETEGRSAEKIKNAIRVCRLLLTANGQLVITVPIGYNPELDGLIANGGLDAERETFLKQETPRVWKETGKKEALACQYKKPYPYANAILVAEFRR